MKRYERLSSLARGWPGRVQLAGCARRPTVYCVPFSARLTVPGYKVEQRHILLGERNFHFVSYEGRPANVRRGEDAEGPMWCLMSEGRRRPVMPHTPGQNIEELDRQLVGWLRSQL